MKLAPLQAVARPMRYYELMLLAALAVLAVTNTIGSLCLSLTWRKVADAKWTPLARARVLLGLRLAPSLIGALCAALTLIAFLRYEPPSTTEAPSMLLLTGSAVGLGIVMSGLSRGVKRLRDTAKFVAHLERTAAPVVVRGVPLPAWLVDTTFPLVAVTGIWRPRLLIAGNVLTELDEEQLDLVVRHELAHARHGDNMSRLLMAVAPDAVSLYGGARPLEHAWRQAAEEAADDYAVGIDTAARLSLASALLRVARLIGDQPPSRLLVPAFHEGASIEKRIRRLVADNEPPVRALQALRLPLPIGACFLVAGVVLQWDAVLMSIHTAIEWVIHMRP